MLEKSDVERIAFLARLKITADEAPRYAQELSNVLEFVRQMERIDTTGVEPLAHPLDAIQRLRPDHVSEIDQRDLFQALAPRSEDGLYLVPKVIE